MNIKDQKKWDNKEFHGEIQSWLTFLLSLVDVVNESANECLKHLFSGKYRCCVDYHKFLKKEVSSTRVRNEISTDMNNRTQYNSDRERYRLIYIT